MKKFFTIASAILFTFVLISVARSAPKIETIATISGVQGEVQVQKGGGAWAPVKDGALVKSGDTVKTGAQSSCVIKWGQGNVIKLTAFSQMRLDKLEKNLAAGAENSSLNMWSGKMYAQAKKLNNASSSFEVKTPTAIAGVRGTKLGVGVGADDSTTVECLEGSVSVRGVSGGEVLLSQKQKTEVIKNQQPQSPAPMAQEDTQGFQELDDAAGAMLDITQPVGDLDSDVSPVMVKGKTDPGGSVSVNGQQVTADGTGSFSASVELSEGTNQIKIEATNKNGKTATKTRVIKFRPRTETPGESATGTQPMPEDNSIDLTLTSPTEGVTTRDSNIQIMGRAKPGSDVTVNDIPLPVSPGNGVFTGSFALMEGENVITVTGKKGSNSQSIIRRVTKDTTPPRLLITRPAQSFDVGAGDCYTETEMIYCNIVGLTEFGAQLQINGLRVRVEEDGSFSHLIQLGKEETTINVNATDNAGNRANAILTRIINRSTTENLELTVTPTTISGDGQSTAIATIKTTNFLGEPTSASVLLTATYGVTPQSMTVISENGMATVMFTAGVPASPTNVILTAVMAGQSGSITKQASLMLTPDVPPAR